MSGVNDPHAWQGSFAARTAGLSASEVRALFAVASRPEVVSLAGGMPFVSALPIELVTQAVERTLRERGAEALHIVARHVHMDHLDRATGKAKGHRPDGAAAAPVDQGIERPKHGIGPGKKPQTVLVHHQGLAVLRCGARNYFTHSRAPFFQA